MTDDNDGRFNLSRRKALAGLGSIGVAGALGGLGTTAMFTDEEGVEATFTAGELDLKLNWQSTYNGQLLDGSGYEGSIANDVGANIQTQPANADGKLILSLDDVKPGDTGCTVVSVHIEDNPSFIWAKLDGVGAENGYGADAEADAEGEDFSTSAAQDGGELLDAMHVNVFYDDSWDCEFNPVFDSTGTEVSITADDVPQNEDGDYTTPPFTAFRTIGNSGLGQDRGMLLDGVRGTGILSRKLAAADALWLSPFYPSPEDAVAELEIDGRPTTASNTITTATEAQNADGDSVFAGEPSTGTFASSPADGSAADPGTQFIAFQWAIPKSVGNEIQSDSLDVSFTLAAQQARHNAKPVSPFTGGDPRYPIDLAPEVDPANYFGNPYGI